MDGSKCRSIPEENLLRLEERIALMERLVMGTKINMESQVNLVDPLVDIITKLRTVTAGRENYNQLFKSLEEYGPFIQKIDQFDGSTEPDAVKLELILAQEDKIRERAALLDCIVAKQKVIDSSAFKDIAPLEPRLKKLSTIVNKQSEEAKKFSQETQELIKSYNQFLLRIKTHMVNWDKKLSALEAEKKSKRPKNIMAEFD